MKVGRGNSARGVAAAAILGFLAFALLVQYAPDSVAYSPNNYGWNGLHAVASAYGVKFTTGFASIPPGSTLVVGAPSINFTGAQADAVRAFLARGGTLLVADKSGVANSLLLKLGSAITIQNGYAISDTTYNWKSGSLPTALVLPGAGGRFGFLSNVTGIAMNQPAPLQISGSRAVEVAITSQFSTATSSSPGVAGLRGPFVVAAAEKFGNGTLLVVGASQFLLNSEWTLANNRALIGNLFANGNVFVDTSHWGASSTAQVKAEVGRAYSLVSATPARYIAALFVVGLALMLVPSEEKEPKSR
jgi:Domain of unknown function (DUF4350)